MAKAVRIVHIILTIKMVEEEEEMENKRIIDNGS
jgi:hypothetical protein